MLGNKILTVLKEYQIGDVLTRDIRNYDFVLQSGENVKLVYGDTIMESVVLSVHDTIVKLKVV